MIPICPICKSEKTELKLILKDYLISNGKSDDFQICSCNECKNGFTLPFMTNCELEKYYPDDYECYKSHKSFTGFIQKLKSGIDVRIIKKTLKNYGKDVFEIGAGSGLFLSLLKNKNFNVTGIEPGLSGRKYAKDNFNIDLENSYFDDYGTENKFDMILAFHVLEHFNEPVSMIKKMKVLLKKDGRVFIKVPRMDSWPAKLYLKFWHGYDVPRHRVHFTKDGLVNILRSENFEIDLFKNDFGPLDTVRAIKYFSQFAGSSIQRIIFKTINLLPYSIKLFIALFVELILLPFKSGRMSIIARKTD